MAASVENRRFTHPEPAANGLGRNFKPVPSSHRSDSPERCRQIPSSPKKRAETVEDSSSEDENENDYRELIQEGNGELEPSILDSRDEATADKWIERNATMVRLTGKHPFNSEAPLTRLMHHGFITPVPLHYVRNPGPVPKGRWEDWTVEVCGLVNRPARFTMDRLVTEFQSREFPVTLVCAGNRRKEQNMVKQTIGFNWGAAGVSTSVWRGVLLRDVLKRCGIFSRKRGALNVCFEGAEDLPGGGGSKYGTSIKYEIAMDPSRDIILGYMQNGERLSPDHGFPVRMIIPGFIGGRMVKWLKRIIVTTQESNNYYHYNDNRVLPSHVDAELANAEGTYFWHVIMPCLFNFCSKNHTVFFTLAPRKKYMLFSFSFFFA
jgi:nitrate reductase (NAD(P)H)